MVALTRVCIYTHIFYTSDGLRCSIIVFRYSNMCPSIVDQHLHLIYQALKPRFVTTITFTLPLLYPPAHTPLLESHRRRPTTQSIFPKPDKAVEKRWPGFHSVNCRISLAVIANTHVYSAIHQNSGIQGIAAWKATGVRRFLAFSCHAPVIIGGKAHNPVLISTFWNGFITLTCCELSLSLSHAGIGYLVELRMYDIRILVPIFDIDPHLQDSVSSTHNDYLRDSPFEKYSIRQEYCPQSMYYTFSQAEQRS